MATYLLTGAGFSRNWGGWLATEAFEYLLGYPQITPELRHKLWHGKTDGFESVLNQLRRAYQERKDEASRMEVKLFERMLEDMFNAMNLGFKQVEFDPLFDPHRIGPQPDYVRQFLTHFDAIFTLNQDCLLEMKYHKTGFSQISQNRFRDMYCPGIEPVQDLSGKEYMPLGLFKPSESFWTENHKQPYFKLHGSSNWRDGDSALLIMGGNKGPDIENNRLLRIYRNEFSNRISQPNSRLVVIGYSFQDSHINVILENAAKAGAKIFIIDLAGVDVLDGAVNTPSSTQPYRNKIQDSIAGASRRQLQITFSTDHIERGKIWRFINRPVGEG